MHGNELRKARHVTAGIIGLRQSLQIDDRPACHGAGLVLLTRAAAESGQADSPEARAAAVRALVDTYFVDADPTALLGELGLPDSPPVSVTEMAFSARAAEYRRLCDRVDVFWTGRDSVRAPRMSADPVRSRDARRAVLLRSAGRCENPGCTGDVQDMTDNGDPILEVDHIRDLALGGPDDPAQMIALCPNCHAVKTRGRTREQLREVLFTETRRRHEALLASS
jgi:5-methylcytosine-specific restriction enzyme A